MRIIHRRSSGAKQDDVSGTAPPLSDTDSSDNQAAIQVIRSIREREPVDPQGQ
jgi:hypothetical protein